MWTMHTFKKMNRNKWDNNFPPQLFQCSVTGGRSLCRQLRVQLGNSPTVDRTRFCLRVTHTPTHSLSDWDNVDRPVHCLCTSLVCGRKPKSLEKTPYGQRPSWGSVFPPRHYNDTTCCNLNRWDQDRSRRRGPLVTPHPVTVERQFWRHLAAFRSVFPGSRPLAKQGTCH